MTSKTSWEYNFDLCLKAVDNAIKRISYMYLSVYEEGTRSRLLEARKLVEEARAGVRLAQQEVIQSLDGEIGHE